MKLMLTLDLTQEDLILLQTYTRSTGSGIEPLVNRLVQEKVAKIRLKDSKNNNPITTET